MSDTNKQTDVGLSTRSLSLISQEALISLINSDVIKATINFDEMLLITIIHASLETLGKEFNNDYERANFFTSAVNKNTNIIKNMNDSEDATKH